MKVFLIEDEESIANPLKEFLEGESFTVTVADTVEKAKELFHSGYHAVILDWRLPDGEGIHLISFLQTVAPSIPVLMLTARADLVDKVVGLEMGSTDYITKPFAPRELLIRLKNHIKNSQRVRSFTEVESRKSLFKVDQNRLKIHFKEKELELSKLEYRLLKFFIENKEHVFSREELLDQVWGFENYPTTRTVDNHVLQLRQKTDGQLIKTVRGAGYLFTEEDLT